MARITFTDVETAEDADVTAIRKALEALQKAGVPEDRVTGYLYNLVSPSRCDECRRVWLYTGCYGIPGWEEHVYRRGRRTELTEVRKKLTEAGWNSSPDYCDTCRLSKAEPLGREVAKLPAPEMKKFVATFSLRITAALGSGGGKFRDSESYKFYVLFTKAFFEGVPAKNRKSFDLLTKIMHQLELL